jgi:hypothetical protein
MTMTCKEIGTFVLRVQNEFLRRPNLRLTPQQARRAFGADEGICEAVLTVLADAGVLAKMDDGTYTLQPVVACAA